jgi:hypothetical protein
MTDLVDGVVGWLAALPDWLTFSVLLALLAVPTLLLLHFLRGRVSHETMKRHHDVAGIVFAAVGGLYGVLLAFTVVLAFEHHHETEAATWAEAGAHHGMLDLLALAGEAEAQQAEEAIARYTTLVVEEEFASSNYEGRSAPAEDSFRAIWTVVPQVPLPTDAAEEQLLRQLATADDARTERLRGAQGAIQTSLWIVLAVGAAATIGFSLLFSVESYASHLLVVGGLVFVIALALFVNVQLNFPFIGSDAVGADAFASLVQESSSS